MEIWYRYTPVKINFLDQGIQDTASVVQLPKKYTSQYRNEYESTKTRNLKIYKHTMEIWFRYTPEKMNFLDQGIQDTVSVVQLPKKYIKSI